MMTRASLLIPLALIAALVTIFLTTRPFDYLNKGAPPAEEVTIENTTLDASGIHAVVRAAGSEPVNIAQVQVDGAYRAFAITPAGPVGYLRTARIDIPYPWIAGESHHLLFITASGATFEHTIDVAVATPQTILGDLAGLALVGLFVGIVPVLIGYAFYPALQSFGENGRQFAMALTIGLLVFLFIDTLGEGLEAAEMAAPGLKADIVVWISAFVSFLVLLAVGRRDGRPPEGVALALFIAIGIGVHNLGEGLAIGASFGIGEVALASFLVLGFSLHNVTEGIAISAPIGKERISLPLLAGLAAIAGGPAILGTMSGAFAVSPVWTALAFGVGAGAILQVIVEVGASLMRKKGADAPAWFSPASICGFVGGILIMYATAFFIHG